MARLTGAKKKEQQPTGAEITAAVKGATEALRNKGKAWMKWTAEDVLKKVAVPEGGEAAVLAYIAQRLPALKADAPKAVGIAPADYIVGSIENGISDGHVDFTAPASEDDEEDTDVMEYEHIEVSQAEVKRALKALLSTQDELIAKMYATHTKLNKEFFNGVLVDPLITIERISNRTLGNYTYGKNNLPIENHIRMNHNFVALNEYERVALTVIHETIHQWQDQVLYAKPEQVTFKEIEIPTLDADGKLVFIPGVQKKRPRNWHNQDFKSMAAVVGIPCIGKHCGTGEAKMPPKQSYNRKFQCLCVSSNGHPMTVWCTRPEFSATCNKCGTQYREVGKDIRGGGNIEVGKSHIELPNEDGVEKMMLEKYSTFERFKTKSLKDAFVDEELLKDKPDAQHEQGVYQKGHNAYKWGFLYWVAYNTTSMAEDVDKDDVEQIAQPEETAGKAKKPRAKKETPAAPTEAPKKLGKIVKFPASAEKPSEPEPVKEERQYSVDNAQDIIDLYKELGTVGNVAKKLGVSQSTVSGRVKKFGIDLSKVFE